MGLLFEHGNIGNLELKNRIVMPPMCMYSSDESGKLKSFHHYHYVSKALGGVGLVIVEATAVEPRGRISSKDLGLWDDEQIKKHKKLNKKIHSFGAKTAIQLAHAGRKSEVVDSIPLAPSSISFSKNAPYKIPKEATLKEIKEIKSSFLKAGFRAKRAGYNAIELHAAHGYFLCEFLSDLSNKRDDKYGGSLENRCKLVLEIANDLIQTVKLPLIVRISASEWMKNGWSISDSIYLSLELEKLGVSAIHVSSGGNQSEPDNAPVIAPLYQVDAAKEIKKSLKKIPVIAVGLISDAVEGEYLLKNKYCDFVAYGRALLRNPNLVFSLAKEVNKKDEILVPFQRAY